MKGEGLFSLPLQPVRGRANSEALIFTVFHGNGAMGLNTDLGCGRAMDPGMVLDSSPGPDDTMAPGGSIGNSGLYGPGSRMAHG